MKAAIDERWSNLFQMDMLHHSMSFPMPMVSHFMAIGQTSTEPISSKHDQISYQPNNAKLAENFPNNFIQLIDFISLISCKLVNE